MPEPRRVLFLTHSLGGGGSERVTVNVANHFAQQGATVRVIPLTPAVHEYPVIDNVIVDRKVPQGRIRLLRGAQKARHIVAEIRHFKPDIVISLGAGFGYLALARMVTRFPLITSVRSDPESLLRRHPSRRLSYSVAFALSSRIVFQSAGAIDYFGNGVRRKAVIIENSLPDGLDHNDAPFESREKEIVAFGRMVPQKRLDVLVRAFALFHEQFPEYRLSIFGSGPEREKVVDLIRDIDLSEVISVEGPRPDIHERVRHSAMYVLSSDVEGVSNSMLEAMALGLPSACTDCRPGGAREIIELYQTGLLAERGEPSALASAMCSIAANPERADTMIARGRELLAGLAGNVIGERWERLIAEVV